MILRAVKLANFQSPASRACCAIVSSWNVAALQASGPGIARIDFSTSINRASASLTGFLETGCPRAALLDKEARQRCAAAAIQHPAQRHGARLWRRLCGSV